VVVVVHLNRAVVVALAGFAQAPDLALRQVLTTRLRLVAAVMLLRQVIAHQRVVTPYLAQLPQPAAAVGGLLANLLILQKVMVEMVVLVVGLVVCLHLIQTEQAAQEIHQAFLHHKAATAATVTGSQPIKPKAAVAALAR